MPAADIFVGLSVPVCTHVGPSILWDRYLRRAHQTAAATHGTQARSYTAILSLGINICLI